MRETLIQQQTDIRKLMEENSRLRERVEQMSKALKECREGFRLTREYIGEKTLPAIPGWSWFDADRIAEKALKDDGGGK